MLKTGTLVACTCKDAQHTGTVVAVIGTGYGVAWDARNKDFRKPGNTDPQYPADFLRAHVNDLAFIADSRVRAGYGPTGATVVKVPLAHEVSDAKTCACGCGATVKGLFRPGHDAKLLSCLVAHAKSGVDRAGEAVEAARSLGCSDKLIAKLLSRLA